MNFGLPDWLRKTFPFLFMLTLSASLLDQGFDFFAEQHRWIPMTLAPLFGTLTILFPSQDDSRPRSSGMDAALMSLVWLFAASVVARRALDFELFGWVSGALFALALWGLLRYFTQEEGNSPAGSPWPALLVGLALLVMMIVFVSGPAALAPTLLGGGLLFLAGGYLWGLMLYPAGELDWPVQLGLGFALSAGVQPVVFVYLNRLGMPITPTSVVAVLGLVCLAALAALNWRRGRAAA